MSDWPDPEVIRTRHEPKRRNLRVRDVCRVTPNMVRVRLSGEDLAGFSSVGFDDHIKLFFGPDGAEKRDYTPRRFDPETGELTLDFAIHGNGPATEWAITAQPGDTLTIGGPRGSKTIAGEIEHWLLIGDETALPAMGRFVEEAGAGKRVTLIGAVRGVEEEQAFDTKADLSTHWCHRPEEAAQDPAPLVSVLKALDLPARTFVWIAAEAGVSQALRQWMLDAGHPLTWIKSSGYWTYGAPG